MSWAPGESTAGLAPESSIVIFASSTLLFSSCEFLIIIQSKRDRFGGIQILFLFLHSAWHVV